MDPGDTDNSGQRLGDSLQDGRRGGSAEDLLAQLIGTPQPPALRAQPAFTAPQKKSYQQDYGNAGGDHGLGDGRRPLDRQDIADIGHEQFVSLVVRRNRRILQRDPGDSDRIPFVNRVQLRAVCARRTRDEQAVGFLNTGQQNQRPAQIVRRNFLHNRLDAHQLSQVHGTLQLSEGEILRLGGRRTAEHGYLFRLQHGHPELHDHRTLGFDLLSGAVVVQRRVRQRQLQYTAVPAILDGKRAVTAKVKGGSRYDSPDNHLLSGVSC